MQMFKMRVVIENEGGKSFHSEIVLPKLAAECGEDLVAKVNALSFAKEVPVELPKEEYEGSK